MTTSEHKEQKLKELAELPIDADFSIPDGLIIPMGQKVLIKKIPQKAVMTKSGVMLLGNEDNLKKSTLGLIMAIGPTVDLEGCPIKLGMKVEFTVGLEEDTYHEGQAYLCIDQFHIKGAVPDGNYKHPYFPTKREIRRQEMIDNTKLANDIANKKIDEIQNS